MKVLKFPMINALYTAILSTIYGLMFIFIGVYQSNCNIITNSEFWLSDLISNVTIKYLGMFIFIVGILIDLLQARRVKYYDEYQCEALTKFLVIASFVNIIILPVCLFINMLKMNYGQLILICILFLHWFVTATVQILLYIKNRS